jgi:Surface-adhesin protein E
MLRVMTVLALSMLAALPGAAAEWSYVSPALGKSPAGAKVKGTMEIDVGSVVPVDKVVKAWFKLTYKTDVVNPVNAAKPIRKVKFLYYHLCEEHKRALIQLMYEDASGATVYSSSFPSDPPKFEDVIPDTTGETWLKAACKIAAMKHKTSAKP